MSRSRDCRRDRRARGRTSHPNNATRPMRTAAVPAARAANGCNDCEANGSNGRSLMYARQAERGELGYGASTKSESATRSRPWRIIGAASCANSSGWERRGACNRGRRRFWSFCTLFILPYLPRGASGRLYDRKSQIFGHCRSASVPRDSSPALGGVVTESRSFQQPANVTQYTEFTVPVGATWQVSGVFANTVYNLDNNAPLNSPPNTQAYYELRSDVSNGSGGTLLSSGTVSAVP